MLSVSAVEISSIATRYTPPELACFPTYFIEQLDLIILLFRFFFFFIITRHRLQRYKLPFVIQNFSQSIKLFFVLHRIQRIKLSHVLLFNISHSSIMKTHIVDHHLTQRKHVLVDCIEIDRDSFCFTSSTSFSFRFCTSRPSKSRRYFKFIFFFICFLRPCFTFIGLTVYVYRDSRLLD